MTVLKAMQGFYSLDASGQSYWTSYWYFSGAGNRRPGLAWWVYDQTTGQAAPENTTDLHAWHTAAEDIDRDGLPDSWERTWNLNPNDASDALARIRGMGMTAAQMFANAAVPGISGPPPASDWKPARFTLWQTVAYDSGGANVGYDLSWDGPHPAVGNITIECEMTDDHWVPVVTLPSQARSARVPWPIANTAAERDVYRYNASTGIGPALNEEFNYRLRGGASSNESVMQLRLWMKVARAAGSSPGYVEFEGPWNAHTRVRRRYSIAHWEETGSTEEHYENVVITSWYSNYGSTVGGATSSSSGRASYSGGTVSAPHHSGIWHRNDGYSVEATHPFGNDHTVEGAYGSAAGGAPARFYSQDTWGDGQVTSVEDLQTRARASSIPVQTDSTERFPYWTSKWANTLESVDVWSSWKRFTRTNSAGTTIEEETDQDELFGIALQRIDPALTGAPISATVFGGSDERWNYWVALVGEIHSGDFLQLGRSRLPAFETARGGRDDVSIRTFTRGASWMRIPNATIATISLR